MADHSYHSQQRPGKTSDSDLIPIPPPWGPGSGLSRVIAILLFIILLLIVIWVLYWAFTPIKDCVRGCTPFSQAFRNCICIPDGRGPSAGALAECDRQLASGQFSIPRQTAHERYLTETLGTMKEQLYVMVTLRKRVIGSTSDVESALSSVAVELHRPNDVDPQNNLNVSCLRGTKKETKASADSRGVSEVRWRMFCDLSGQQYDQQEQMTGILKYRVLIKNWSSEAVDYCFVSSCDARYPAGEACNTGYGNPYGTGSYPSASVSGGTSGQ